MDQTLLYLCRYHILFGLNSRVKTKTKNLETNRKKGVKIKVSKPKKGKINKYNMIGWWIKGSQHLKTLFTAIETKTLNGCGQNVDFFIQPLDRVKFWTVS